MKTRNGFVSNSSTSSFLIAVKGNKKILEVILRKILEVPIGYPLRGFVEEVCKTIISCDNDYSFTSTREYLRYLKKEGQNDEGDLEIIDLLGKGYSIYTGSFSDEEGGMEAFLCNTDLNYKSDDLILRHEGGY